MKKHKKNKGEVAYKILTPLMRFLFKVYYRPKIENKESIPKNGPIIIVCNHKHVYDQCLAIIATKRPIHYMAKKEYFDGKFAWFFKLVGCIPVNRSIHDSNAKDKAITILKNGGAIGLFPEGTRNKTNDTLLLSFKFGAVSMAQKTNATIIPSALTGDYKFHSKNLIIRFGKGFKVPKDMDLKEANNRLEKEIEFMMIKNLNNTNSSIEEEIKNRLKNNKK